MAAGPLSFEKLPRLTTRPRMAASGERQSRNLRVGGAEPFFTTNPPGKGSGLGLPAVRSVTRALGGHVEVESELGGGSAFILHFPLLAAQPAGRR